MADQAVGRNCPNDGTLTACSGAFTDENLVGVCAYCSRAVITPNPSYRKPAQDATDEEPATEAEEASLQQAASTHNYADVIVSPPPQQAPAADDDEMEPAPASAVLPQGENDA